MRRYGLPALDSPAPKAWRFGTERATDPAATVERLRPLLATMGITRVADVTGLDHVGIPVTMVVRPNARSLSVSQGKGITLDAAKASGLMESIELWHAERIDRPLRHLSRTELARRHRAVEVEGLPFCAGSRYHPDRPMLWIEGRDLIQGEDVWVPFEMVNMATARPELPGGCFVASSNGLASGNNLLEAVIHGLCEVIERDATTLWHLGDEATTRDRRVDLATVDDEACAAALARYRRAGLAVVAWDITSDTGVPAFQALVYETGAASRDLYASIGMGAHTTRHVALLRALTEAAQSRLTLIAGSRDDVFRNEYECDEGGQRFLDAERALLAAAAPAWPFAATPSEACASFNEDLDWLLGRLEAVGIARAILVDLTLPEIGLPVARVIVPGLESFDKIPGYVPGRRAAARHAA
jgi:ribosomal protein S12 methylthiotransferase accessory factor